MSVTATRSQGRASKATANIQSGVALMHWRRERGIPRKLFAQMADFSERKLATYEKADNLPKKVIRPVTETVRLIQALQKLAGGDDAALRNWLEAPNPVFKGKTPLTVIADGESDLLWEMAYQIRHGEFA